MNFNVRWVLLEILLKLDAINAGNVLSNSIVACDLRGWSPAIKSAVF